MTHKMDEVVLRNLSNFFLLVGNGETLDTLRGLIKEVERGVSLEGIFKKIIAQARLQAEKEKDPFAGLKSWSIIAGHTGDDADLAMVEDLLSKITAPNQRAVGKKLLVKALAKSGNLEDARTMAGNIRSAYWRAEAYLEVYKVSNDQGDLASAEATVEAINSSELQTEVIAQIKAAQRSK